MNAIKLPAGCASCARCSIEDINGNVLCREKGITSYNYHCHRYKVRPAVTSPSKTLRNTFITCSRCKYYDDRSSEARNTGVCLFYKLRPFPGEKRKACSNFVMQEQDDSKLSFIR